METQTSDLTPTVGSKEKPTYTVGQELVLTEIAGMGFLDSGYITDVETTYTVTEVFPETSKQRGGIAISPAINFDFVDDKTPIILSPGLFMPKPTA